MKGLKKLVLASAIIAASSSAFAMQAMDDESMSATTGQDGITISMDTNLSGLGITYIDRDGITGSSHTSAGGIIISPLGIQTTGVKIDIDAGGSAGTGAGNGMLQIQVTTPNNTVVNLNNTKISVADATAAGSTVGTPTDIITFSPTASLTIAGSATPSLTIQLGAEDQGAMIKATSDIPTLTLTGMTINDANSGGSIGIGSLTIANVHAVNSIDVTSAGLVIDTTGTTLGEVGLERVRLGSTAAVVAGTAPAIGDIYITGLAPTGTITVSGH